jgi:hypothetical protein
MSYRFDGTKLYDAKQGKYIEYRQSKHKDDDFAESFATRMRGYVSRTISQVSSKRDSQTRT